MMKAKGGLAFAGEAYPIGASRFEETISADEVGLNELGRPVDGTVHMGLRRKMHDRVRLIMSKLSFDRRAIADIHPLEVITRAGRLVQQGFQIARVGELVHVDDGGVARVDKLADHPGTDKSGAAGNQNLHNIVSFKSRRRMP